MIDNQHSIWILYQINYKSNYDLVWCNINVLLLITDAEYGRTLFNKVIVENMD